MADLTNLSVEQLQAVAEGDANYFTNRKQEKTEKGKARKPKPSKTKNRSTIDVSAKLMAKAREVIATIAENIDILIYGTNTKTISSALVAIKGDESLQNNIKDEFGVEFSVIQFLFESSTLNEDLIQLIWDK